MKRNMPERFCKMRCSNTSGTERSIPKRRGRADFESRMANRNEDRFTSTRQDGEQLNFPKPKSTIRRLFHETRDQVCDEM